jgi:hypothetical protein
MKQTVEGYEDQGGFHIGVTPDDADQSFLPQPTNRRRGEFGS